MANVGILSILFKGDASQLERTFTKVGAKAVVFGNVVTQGLNAAAKGAANFVTGAINIAKENENTITSFKNLTGSIFQAKELYQDLIDFSSKTPFSSKEIQSGATTLLGFGLNAKEATSAIKDLGAAAAANADTDLKRLIVSFGQIQGANVAMTKDLREFVNNGIPIYQILADTLDVSVSQINEMASQGKITGDVITRAFRESASEGGRFADTLHDQSQTLSGLTSTLKDNYNIALGNLGSKLLPAAKEAASGFNDLLIDMNKGFLSDESTDWGLRVAAAVKVAFDSAANFQLAWAKLELLTAGFFDALFLGLGGSSEKLEAAEQKVKDLEASVIPLGKAFDDALRELKFDKALQGLSNLVDGVKEVEGVIGDTGGNGGQKEFKAAIGLTNEEISEQQRLLRELAKDTARKPSDLTREQLAATASPFSAAAPTVGGFNPFEGTLTPDVEEIDAAKLSKERAEAIAAEADAMSQATAIAQKFGDVFTRAHEQGIPAVKALALATLSAAKDIIGAKIREGVVEAALGALKKSKVGFPFNVILAGLAGGAAEALFRTLVSSIKIPAFGDGGVVFGPTLALIGEKGPEAIVPLGRNSNRSGQHVNITGVQYGADTYWQNANVGLAGRLIYGG